MSDTRDSLAFFDKLRRDIRSEMYVSMFGRVESFDASVSKVAVSPLNKEFIRGSFVTLPQLIELPLLKLGGGGFIINYPVEVGDIVLVIFSDTDISNIVLDGKASNPPTDRVHSVQDSIALPLSLNLFTSSISAHTSDLVLAKDDYSSKIVMSANGNIDITTDGDVTINCDTYTVNQSNP